MKSTDKVFALLVVIGSLLCNSCRQPNSPEPKRLKVVCWNVLYGFNHGESIESGKEWLDDQRPDVVALQELNGYTSTTLANAAKSWRHNHSAILKENGFPVGLTSTLPIEVIERGIESYHHGFLHAKTHGIHFFVVHFWPGKDHEAQAISKKIQAQLDQGQRVIVLGDFNSHSRKDADFLAASTLLEPHFAVIELFESQGFVDLINKHDANALYSAPSPITIPQWSNDMTELALKRQRIDFILAEKDLAKASSSGTIIINEQIEAISDHYPAVVEFSFPE